MSAAEYNPTIGSSTRSATSVPTHVRRRVVLRAVLVGTLVKSVKEPAASGGQGNMKTFTTLAPPSPLEENAARAALWARW
jgi:hypothetical protein